MNEHPEEWPGRLGWAVELFTRLIGPILVLLTGLSMLIYTHIIHPPPEPVTSAAGGTLIALALGRGFDKLDRLRGR